MQLMWTLWQHSIAQNSVAANTVVVNNDVTIIDDHYNDSRTMYNNIGKMWYGITEMII